jgi:hypothetical protein
MIRVFVLILLFLGADAYAQANKSTLPKTKAPATSVDDDLDDDEANYRVTLDEKESRFFITIYSQFSQFTNQGKDLVGAAFEAQATYALMPTIALGMSLAQALNMEGGLSITYTGLRASTGYALSGKYIQRESVVSVDKQTTYVSSMGQGPLFALEAGLNQLMFNGGTRIVPATGLSLGVRYDRMWGKYNLSLNAVYGSLVISEAAASMLSVGVGILMRF